MDIRFNFKDNTFFQFEASRFENKQNFFQMIENGIKNDATITVGDGTQKKWNEVKSVEVVL